MYGVGVIINYFVYRLGGKISIMYPIIATSYIWAILLAVLFLGDSLTIGKVVGSILIIGGVLLIAVW